jgi:TolB protein
VANGLNPRPIEVPFNDTALVIFTVECPYEDGELIAYTGGPDIYTVHPDGTRLRQLTTNAPYSDKEPAWSPGGTRIAFGRVSEGSSGIFVMDADGGNQLRLTTPGGEFSEPAWSPDGSRIAFNHDNAIWLINADGTNAVQLVGDGSGPDWSPDGKRIAYSGRGSLGGIWTIGADGHNDARLTLDNDSEPAWSPDGTRIAFHRDYYGGWYYQDTHDIYVVNADGSALTQLTSLQWTGGWVGSPTWKADGSTIAFSGASCIEDCSDRLWLVNPYSLRVNQIPTPSPARSPAWRR